MALWRNLNIGTEPYRRMKITGLHPDFGYLGVICPLYFSRILAAEDIITKKKHIVLRPHDLWAWNVTDDTTGGDGTDAGGGYVCPPCEVIEAGNFVCHNSPASAPEGPYFEFRASKLESMEIDIDTGEPMSRNCWADGEHIKITYLPATFGDHITQAGVLTSHWVGGERFIRVTATGDDHVWGTADDGPDAADCASGPHALPPNYNIIICHNCTPTSACGCSPCSTTTPDPAIARFSDAWTYVLPLAPGGDHAAEVYDISGDGFGDFYNPGTAVEGVIVDRSILPGKYDTGFAAYDLPTDGPSGCCRGKPDPAIDPATGLPVLANGTVPAPAVEAPAKPQLSPRQRVKKLFGR